MKDQLVLVNISNLEITSIFKNVKKIFKMLYAIGYDIYFWDCITKLSGPMPRSEFMNYLVEIYDLKMQGGKYKPIE